MNGINVSTCGNLYKFNRCPVTSYSQDKLSQLTKMKDYFATVTLSKNKFEKLLATCQRFKFEDKRYNDKTYTDKSI